MDALKKQQTGFTLIELVAVIVILGVLAATAVVRFQDLSTEAQIARLQDMRGVLQSATTMVASQAQVEGKVVGTSSIILDGFTVNTYGGYPVGTWVNSIRHLISRDDQHWTGTSVTCSLTWCGVGNLSSLPGGLSTASGSYVKVFPQGYSFSDLCAVYYLNPENNQPITIGIQTSDC